MKSVEMCIFFLTYTCAAETFALYFLNVFPYPRFALQIHGKFVGCVYVDDVNRMQCGPACCALSV